MFFIIFKELSVAKNCLSPGSTSLVKFHKEIILNNVVKNTSSRKNINLFYHMVILMMAYKCFGDESTTVFSFPNRKDCEYTSSSCICMKHFEENVFDPKKVNNERSEINSVTSLISILRRSPTKRLYQEHHYELFICKDSVKDFKCLNGSFSVSWYTLRKSNNHILFTSQKKMKCQYCQYLHCVKSVQIRSFSWFAFSCIRTEYGDLLQI